MKRPEFVATIEPADIAALDGVCESAQAVSAAQARHLLGLARFTRDRLARILGSTVDTPEAQEHAWRSLVAETACALHMGEGQARSRIDLAWALTSHLTATLDALGRGAITLEHATVIVDQAAAVPEQVRVVFEGMLLPVAESTTPRRLRDAAQRLRERLHPETIEIRHAKARDERSVWMEAELDGMATIHHVVTAVDARAMLDAVETQATRMRKAGDARGVAALRSDVLRDFVLGGEGSTSGVRGIVPTVIVTIPVETLLGLDERPADLSGYGAIDANTARALAARAPSLTRMFTDPIDASPLAIGRTKYYPTADMRRMLVLNDKRCRFPHCGRPAMYSELDHTEAWADGGETDVANLAALCTWHHHLKHEDGWEVARIGRDVLHWTSPLGRTYDTVPEALFDAEHFGIEPRRPLSSLLGSSLEPDEVPLEPPPDLPSPIGLRS